MGIANFSPWRWTELTVIFPHISPLLFDRKQFERNPLDSSVMFEKSSVSRSQALGLIGGSNLKYQIA